MLSPYKSLLFDSTEVIQSIYALLDSRLIGRARKPSQISLPVSPTPQVPPQPTPNHSPRYGLEFRTRDSTLLSGGKGQQSTPKRKPDYVDLTANHDDEPTTHIKKKPRSSSESTEVSAETNLNASVNEPGYQPSYLKTKPPAERDLVSRSSSPLIPSGKLVSAVLVGPPQPSPEVCRDQFLKNLSVLGRGVSLFNNMDTTSPPTSFQFVTQSILGPGVQKTTEDFMSGCKCRKDNGRNIGCEYLSCECLDDSARNASGNHVFPYSASKSDFACLRSFYLESRHHIYECNNLCNCESNCKNRVVQHGRTVPLQIYKTSTRGWGLRCMQDLKRGQFIDTYRGEIITHEEANKRHQSRTVDQEIYLMELDKWTEADGAAQYVCDGMHVSGPTRFINHSCDPNCAIYTVSCNHADINIYDLAFFATQAIPKGTELTFDYVSDEDPTPITEKRADEMEKERGYRPAKCLCGTAACRGYFFQ